MFTFDPYSPAIHRDPFPLYKILRDEHPAYYSEAGGCWVLSRYHDVVAAVLDYETFSSAKGNIIDDSPARYGATLGTTDPPRHDELRKLVHAAFLSSNLERMAEPCRVSARTILERHRETGGLDLVDELATPVVTGALSRLLGFPAEDHRQIRRWVNDSIRRDPVTRRSPPEGDAARKALTEYTRRIIADRRRAPGDDVISGLILARVDGASLADREVLMTSRTLLAAGVESTVSFFGNLALNLMVFDDARRRLIQDPARIPTPSKSPFATTRPPSGSAEP